MGYFFLVLLFYGNDRSPAVIPQPYYGLEACQVAAQVTKEQGTGGGNIRGFYCVPGKPLEND